MEWTADWFSHVIPIWNRIAVPRLKDRTGDGLEIGTYEGRSALWTLQHLLPQPSRRLVCVDRWTDPRIEARFDANCREAGLDGRVIKHGGASSELLRRFTPTPRFDWIYIDGSHEGRDCLTDAVLSYPLLRPHGIMVFDDYEWKSRGTVYQTPRPAIDAFLLLWGDELEILHRGYQVMVARRS